MIFGGVIIDKYLKGREKLFIFVCCIVGGVFIGLTYTSASKYLFIKIRTDEGITGIGEVGVWGFLDAAEGALNKLKGYLIGKNPFQIEHHWQYMYRSMYFRGSVIMSAISAIDIALWDIKGKALGVPVYELLGGKCRDKVRSYPAVFKFTAEQVAENVKV